MNKTLKWILISVAILVGAFLLLYLPKTKGANTIKVTADVVKRGSITETVSTSGKLFPELEVKLGSGITGEVTDLYVKEGDSVKKGQVLARILSESNTSRMSLRGTDYNSILQSLNNPVPSKATAINIKSPIDGIVSVLNVRKGERVGGMTMQGSEILKVADMSSMNLRAEVNENDIIKINEGDSADIEIEAFSKRKFKGVVTYISNTVSRKENSLGNNDVTTYEVHIHLNADSYKDLVLNNDKKRLPFRPGMNARADVKTNRKENILFVPVAAVTSRVKGGDEAIGSTTADEEVSNTINELEEIISVIEKDGIVSSRVVTTGIQDMFKIEIITGLKEGEKIVTGPYSAVSKNLKNGNSVKVVPKEELFEKE
ncbi:MAG TPA: efflux RND transporter periplasmic adaptor subunit [Flavisolibacter sp.]|nr:efflux RND transporter periplasmic adaptor subunit [Flavisolibacter sp.]